MWVATSTLQIPASSLCPQYSIAHYFLRKPRHGTWLHLATLLRLLIFARVLYTRNPGAFDSWSCHIFFVSACDTHGYHAMLSAFYKSMFNAIIIPHFLGTASRMIRAAVPIEKSESVSILGKDTDLQQLQRNPTWYAVRWDARRGKSSVFVAGLPKTLLPMFYMNHIEFLRFRISCRII